MFHNMQQNFQCQLPTRHTPCELKVALGKEQSFFTQPVKQAQAATEASFRAAHYVVRNKQTNKQTNEKCLQMGRLLKG